MPRRSPRLVGAVSLFRWGTSDWRHNVWNRALRAAAKAADMVPRTTYRRQDRTPQGTHTKSTRGGWKVREADGWAGRSRRRKAGNGSSGSRAGTSQEALWVLGDDVLAELVDPIPTAYGDHDAWIEIAYASPGLAGLGPDRFRALGGGGYDRPPIIRGTGRRARSGGGPCGAGRGSGRRAARGVRPSGKRSVFAGSSGYRRILPGTAARWNPCSVPSPTASFEEWRPARFNHDSGCWHRFAGGWAPAQVAQAWVRDGRAVAQPMLICWEERT
jgi:hypothetical protein